MQGQGRAGICSRLQTTISRTLLVELAHALTSGYNHYPWKSRTQQLLVRLLLIFWLSVVARNATSAVGRASLHASHVRVKPHPARLLVPTIQPPPDHHLLKTLFVLSGHTTTVQWVQPTPMKKLNPTASRSSTVDLADESLRLNWNTCQVYETVANKRAVRVMNWLQIATYMPLNSMIR